MKLPQGLALRIVAVAALGALLGVPAAFIPLAQFTAAQAIRRSIAFNQPGLRAQHELCVASPDTWRIEREGMTAFAYDSDTLRSVNPTAPTLNLALVKRLRAGEFAPSEVTWTPPLGGSLVAELNPSGPCAILGLFWKSDPQTSDRTMRQLVIVVMLVLLVVGIGAMLLAVRPLVRRIEALATTADAIGDTEQFQPVDDAASDALGRLGRRIAESHDRIVTANAALQDRTRALERHLEDVAHDVRTPLAALQLRLESLIGHAESQQSSQRAELVASLDDVIYLTSLTENLRLASRLEEGLDPVAHGIDLDVGEILRRVVNRFSTLGDLRDIRVRGSWPDEPVWVRCDPALAEQALANLVQNAVIYGERGGSVTVLLDRVDGADDRFELAVIDDGPGVPPEVMPRLLDRRMRGDEARSRGPKGSGLGLAIVAEACDRSGWTLDFEHLEPRGLKVSIRGCQASPQLSSS